MPRHSIWKVARASKQGTKNQQRDRECQDSCLWAVMPRISPDTLVAAVADGLGSAELSRDGAQIAIQASIHEATTLIQRERQPIDPARMETILDTAILSARNQIQMAAKQREVPPSKMATTLLLAVHTHNMMATAQVGDGAAVVSVKDNQFITFSKPERGEYTNETYSLTSRRALQHCRIDIAVSENPIQTIALMTDGMVHLTLAHTNLEPHEPFFKLMTSWLAEYQDSPHPNIELGETLQSEKIRRKTDDDTTLLLAIRT